MELIAVEIQGFRRFNDPTSVRLLENLIAVIGQNESGKTSFLEALEELNHEEEISDQDQTRRVDTDTTIAATFSLEEGDYTDLGPVENSDVIEKCTFVKTESGQITAKTQPKPNHDLQPRQKVRSKLESFLETEVFDERVGRNPSSNLKRLSKQLESDEDYLGDETITRIQESASNLEKVVEDLESDQYDANSVKEMIGSFQELAEHERNSSPKQARDILLNRRPKFLSFDEDDRDLKSKYDLSNTIPNPPSALSNVAKLADLNLQELKKAAESGKVHVTRDLTEDASEELEKEFSKSWVRSDVVPVLDINGTVLHINVRTPDEQNRAPIHQRSDGLRWFVALVSFLNQRDTGENPVLLVDEAERHLSYDAQAELVEVLETQTVAQKVIYTTHSAGCLPSDLGRGIRPVIQKEGERSDINNGFWVDEPGFKPIMMAMGLNPLAFTVARNSLIAEGPCETILLPTLIRQATGKEELEYQIAPGAANVGEKRISELLSETGRSVILLDGDGGGVENREDLVEAGADAEKIKTYRTFSDEGLILEDFIDPEKYIEAVNDELNEWQEPGVELDVDDIPDVARVHAVENWCEESGLDAPSKVNVSQRLVKMASEGANIVDSKRVEVLCEIDDWATSCFVHVSDP
ncbi:AAA family ATPase [Halorubrum halophilum]|uniref:AAA family ATPase n=1 Tax=Halorubrum halophilum TaxID=413816 RepID=UPI0009E2F8CD|nr:AAA family ATPase [Halorubrum halophilum]